MTKEWQALAALAAKKEGFPEVNKELVPNLKNTNRGVNKKIGRRGGKGLRKGIEEYLDNPQKVIDSDETGGYKLAVLIAQQNKMGDSWNLAWDEELIAIRSECHEGLHPVWSKLAKEAGLFAELSRFKNSEVTKNKFDSSDWIIKSYFDPEDSLSLKKWLGNNLPFNAKTEQVRIIQKIEKDLAKKPRFEEWSKWIDPILKNQSKELCLIEGIILASIKHQDAIATLERITEESMIDVADRHIRLLKLRSGNLTNWAADSKIVENDPLSDTIRNAAWKQIDSIEHELSVDDLSFGVETLLKSGDTVPNSLGWKLVESLHTTDKISEAQEFAHKLQIENNSQLKIALKLEMIENFSIENIIINSITHIDPHGLTMIAENVYCSIPLRVIAANKLSNLDSIRYTSNILDVYTEAAEIDKITKELMKDVSLAKVYPQRVLLVWHMITAKSAIGLIEDLETMRGDALISISDSPDDSVLSEVSKALISLLDGMPEDISAIHEKLDSEGLKALNEVRRALSPEGDSMVRSRTIERLEESIENASLSYLERVLFQSLRDSLLLNRAAIDIESGMIERIKDSNQILVKLIKKENVSMQTIKFVTEIAIEHGKTLGEGIDSLEKWYRKNDNNSLESRLIRAVGQSSRGNDLEAAREYKDAARKVQTDYEKYALIMRKSLISYAHGKGWKEAVNLINSNDALAASVTKRFQLYLNVCNDDLMNKKEVAKSRLRQYALTSIQENEGGMTENRGMQIEALELLMRYPEDLDPPLPKSPFQGRVKAAISGLQNMGRTNQDDLDLAFETEIHREKKDMAEITSIAKEMAEEKPISGLRKLERAIASDKFNDKQIHRLKSVAVAMFGGHSTEIPIRERKTLLNLSLKPLVMVDTNILIDALKDDLLMEVTGDSFGSLNWNVERSFHWMLRRRHKEKLMLMNIPPAAKSEFLNRTKRPEDVLKLFTNKVYIDSKLWNEKITENLLKQKVDQICKEFGGWDYKFDKKEMKEIELEDFLLNHKSIFTEINNQKLSRGDTTKRSTIEGEEIYPESGDLEIMRSAALLAKKTNPEIGSIVIATRDSDFKLISRALEEKYGFGVVGDAQELNRRVLK